MAETQRLFWALELPEDLRSALAEDLAPVRRRTSWLHWIEPAHWHATVCFLGEIAESRIEGVTEAGVRASSACEPIELALDGFGRFPERGAARVWWIGLAGEVERLRTAAEALAVEMLGLGLEVDLRPLVPHVTVARAGRRGERREPAWDARPARAGGRCFAVREWVLYRSHLGPRGPRYEALFRATLGRS
jgi:2'-5' RNA ligase